MKSYETTAFAIYDGILKDATMRWCNLVASMDKDMSYLRRAVEQRGLPFLTIVLPSMAKTLMKWLDLGVMDFKAIPQGYPCRLKRPKLFGGFFDMIFDEQGSLRQDVDVEAVAILFQLLSLCKNVRLDCHPSKVKEALHEFFNIEDRLPLSHANTWDNDCPEWLESRYGHPLWGSETGSHSCGESLLQEVLPFGDLNLHSSPDLPWMGLRAHARRIVHSWIGEYPHWELEPRHGPGAVSEKVKGVKYDFQNWPSKLEGLFPYDWYGSGLLESYPYAMPDSRERPSRLIAVPKTQKGPRLICAEPMAHQWIQQGIWRWLESRVNSTPLRASINFRDQSLSQERALDASRDGMHCTIDLSSASDRISTRLVEYLFQGSPLLDALHASRTRCMVQDLDDDCPRMIKLRKFSTMGSAVTFPIQSLVFYILVTWAVRLAWSGRGDFVGSEDFTHEWGGDEATTIFGDDIIAPTFAYNTIKLVLHECGLKVNDSKTFTGKNFRESCGMYAFQGVDISPAYYLQPYDGSPETLAATVESSNNFHLRGYWWAADAVASQIPAEEKRKLLVTGPDGFGGLGLRSFCGSGYHLHKEYWDKDLQNGYVKTLSVSSKSQIVKGQGKHSLSQYFFEKPAPDLTKWESGRVSGVKLRKCLTRVYRAE
nr:MAG: hypothetical protein 3 [Leviviridae sp.]